jgi:hypothetical protein
MNSGGTQAVGAAGQFARQAQWRAFVRSVGMLPVLIALGLIVQVGCVYLTGEGRSRSSRNRRR